MDVRYSDPDHCLTLSAADLRREFLIENLFTPGGIRLVYSHVDRAIAGGAMPLKQPLRLEAGRRS